MHLSLTLVALVCRSAEWLAEAVALVVLLKTICTARSCSRSYTCRLLEELLSAAAADGENTSIEHSFSFLPFPEHKALASLYIVLRVESFCRLRWEGAWMLLDGGVVLSKIDCAAVWPGWLAGYVEYSSLSFLGSSASLGLGLGEPIDVRLAESHLMEPKCQSCWLQNNLIQI